MQEQLKTWQNFKQQAISGEFTLDTDIGSALAARCDELLNSLDGMLKDASDLEFLSGYGGLAVCTTATAEVRTESSRRGATRRRRQCKAIPTSLTST
ncbi:hypothetical protein [Nocardia farcinica]|uniref:hypothetical protein n=1 Tax=Nocardia farcinica TaxID=37329 RepID=UPI001894CFFD|nr:hypothetical protein [Nocardia farcinica]MBF6233759.1 hypothetical protein [Nocardia farcinica]MBF6522593.1 hypothetical protein [Nocardia farcinica]